MHRNKDIARGVGCAACGTRHLLCAPACTFGRSLHQVLADEALAAQALLDRRLAGGLGEGQPHPGVEPADPMLVAAQHRLSHLFGRATVETRTASRLGGLAGFGAVQRQSRDIQFWPIG
jgi:hypothetical protein